MATRGQRLQARSRCWTGPPTPEWGKESAARLSDMASEEKSGLLAPECVGLQPGVGVLFSL